MKLNQNQKKLSAVITNIISPIYNDADLLNTHITAIVLLADQIYSKKEEKPKEKLPVEDINEVYNAYPSKCVVRGASTGKSASNKKKIGTMLKSISKEDLILIIKKYISECKKDNIYMKSFAAFLNNLPDYDIDTLKAESSTIDSSNNKSKNISQWQ